MPILQEHFVLLFARRRRAKFFTFMLSDVKMGGGRTITVVLWIGKMLLQIVGMYASMFIVQHWCWKKAFEAETPVQYYHVSTENLSSEVFVVDHFRPISSLLFSSCLLRCLQCYILLNETVSIAAKYILFARRRRAQILRHFDKKKMIENARIRSNPRIRKRRILQNSLAKSLTKMFA